MNKSAIISTLTRIARNKKINNLSAHNLIVFASAIRLALNDATNIFPPVRREIEILLTMLNKQGAPHPNLGFQVEHCIFLLSQDDQAIESEAIGPGEGQFLKYETDPEIPF